MPNFFAFCSTNYEKRGFKIFGNLTYFLHFSSLFLAFLTISLHISCFYIHFLHLFAQYRRLKFAELQFFREGSCRSIQIPIIINPGLRGCYNNLHLHYFLWKQSRHNCQVVVCFQCMVLPKNVFESLIKSSAGLTSPARAGGKTILRAGHKMRIHPWLWKSPIFPARSDI